jgi:hypothetical protein
MPWYLLVFSLLFLQSAMAEDISIVGNPSIHKLNGVQYIFAHDTNGHLREWWGNPESDWYREDLSALFNGQKIAGNPISSAVNGIQHVFARDINGRLLEWWWRVEDGWHLEDLTPAGETIIGDPFYYNNNNGVQYVFAQDSDGDLRVWWWTAQDAWSSIDLTHFEGLNEDIEGHLAGNPFFAIEQNGTLHVFARNTDGDLIEWWWTPEHGLHIENLTIAVGEQTIVGDPTISFYRTHLKGEFYYTHNVFARSPDGHLLEWQWTSYEGWKLQDLHKIKFVDFISNSGETISGNPKTCSEWKNIFVRDSNDHLKFWKNLSNGWQITDLTNVNGGTTISGNPIADCSDYNTKDIVARNSNGYLHHWSLRGTTWLAREIK